MDRFALCVISVVFFFSDFFLSEVVNPTWGAWKLEMPTEAIVYCD